MGRTGTRSGNDWPMESQNNQTEHATSNLWNVQKQKQMIILTRCLVSFQSCVQNSLLFDVCDIFVGPYIGYCSLIHLFYRNQSRDDQGIH
jgi:hypothetical protein